MKQLRLIILSIASLLLAASCHEIPQYADNPRGNFEALWRTIDEHYCFFREKNIDWNDVYSRYSPMISDKMTAEELFDVCASMLDELRDGHVNLSSSFNTSYYRKWWSDYPQNFNNRIIEKHYFNFNYRQTGSVIYGILHENIGYMRIPSLAYSIGEGNLDNILYYLRTCDGLIIDLRDNGGGSMTAVETIVARFITSRTLAGYISHKNGPAHDDFSEPYPYYYNPAQQGRIMWGKPVAVLTNRSTFSAANNLVSIMKLLPDVKIVGATTGGGSGMPFSSELPNGWGIRFSAAPVLDPLGQTTEFGIEPTEGCAVNLDPQAAIQGRDTILDFAINLLCNQTPRL
ncbi:MAG: S41 family peptidase [Muribaculaceae bacterium]|nr:S41 family peptidase [Muribaculaceae bacterium]